MKKKDWLLAAGICIFAGLMWLGFSILRPENHFLVRITVNGEIYGEYPLNEDREIPIGDTNVCRIRDGSVTMTEAACPDKLCMHQKAVDENGGSIICLPNKVVIEAVGDDGTVIAPQTADAVA